MAVPKAVPLWRRRSCSILMSHSAHVTHSFTFLVWNIWFLPHNYYFLAHIFTFLHKMILLWHLFSHLRVLLLVFLCFRTPIINLEWFDIKIGFQLRTFFYFFLRHLALLPRFPHSKPRVPYNHSPSDSLLFIFHCLYGPQHCYLSHTVSVCLSPWSMLPYIMQFYASIREDGMMYLWQHGQPVWQVEKN